MISARNITKSYRQEGNILRVLRDVTIDIGTGEFLAIVGPSGAGKSTLLHILGGLDCPNEGNVIFETQDVYAMTEQKRAVWRNQKVGFVFQSYYLIPELTALENVILPLMVKNNSRKTSQIEDMGVKLLEQVGLSTRVTHRPSQLSGGEQQRVAIARSLINSPAVLFCDEPTGNLDTVSGQKVMDILLGLKISQNQSVVVVTHDEKISARVDRVVLIKDGQIC